MPEQTGRTALKLSADQIRVWAKEGLSTREMSEKWEEVTGLTVTPNAIRQKAFKAGVRIAQPNPVRDRFIPWAVQPEHLSNYFHKRLLIASQIKRSYGRLPTEAELRDLISGAQVIDGIAPISWKRFRELRRKLTGGEGGLSVGYNPNYVDSETGERPGYVLVFRSDEDYSPGLGIWIHPPSSDD